MTAACPFDGLRATKTMAAFCFHALDAKLQRAEALPPPEEVLPARVNVNGLFVTYETTDGDLRGCIGTFAESPLRRTLAEYSLISALEDRRFRPIQPQELPGLQCTVTVLSRRSTIRRWDDWEIGRHGISLSLSEGRGRHYSSTFLPQVIAEQGWSKEETFAHLLRKAGYPGHPTPEVFMRCEVQTYEGCKEGIDYAEYRAAFRETWGFRG